MYGTVHDTASGGAWRCGSSSSLKWSMTCLAPAAQMGAACRGCLSLAYVALHGISNLTFCHAAPCTTFAANVHCRSCHEQGTFACLAQKQAYTSVACQHVQADAHSMKLKPSRVCCIISSPDNSDKLGLRPMAECPLPAGWPQKFLLSIISRSCGSTLPQVIKNDLVRADPHVAQTLYLCSPMQRLSPSNTPGRSQDKPSDRNRSNDACHGTGGHGHVGTRTFEALPRNLAGTRTTRAMKSHQIEAAAQCAGLMVTVAGCILWATGLL